MRAFGSAFLFGVPLLYTQEMWQTGAHTALWKLLVYLALAFVINIMLVYFSGFKRQRTFRHSVMQAVDALAVGVAASATLLVILNRVAVGDSLASTLARIAMQTVPLSIGASLANALFSEHQSRRGQEDVPVSTDPAYALLNDVGATIGGGLFIGFSIAPTDEVRLLAAHLSLWHALALLLFSLLLTYLIVFANAFSAEHKKTDQTLPFQHPLTETALAYCVSLLVAAVVLYLFNQYSLLDPFYSISAKVLVLGLPVAIGGAAGRVLL
ncbi:MAG: TIGR02587 family membrane protein [Anaerolineales bacterium]